MVALLQIFDTVIVISSFVLDLVFAKGAESDGDQGAVIIVLFLLWRILRIVNSKSRDRLLFV